MGRIKYSWVSPMSTARTFDKNAQRNSVTPKAGGVMRKAHK